MRAYTTRRIINSLVTLLVIIIMNFFMFRLMPGDPIGMMVRSERLTPSMVARMERLYGVDKPLWEQFPIYVKNLLTFNLGISFKYKTAVTPLLVQRMGNTVILLLGATILSIVLGIILGLIAGWYRGRSPDLSILTLGMFTWSMPTFWLAMVFVVFFQGIFPTSGMTDPLLQNPPLLTHLLDLGRHIALPTIILTIVYLGEYIILTRNELTNILTEDYIRTAKAKGLRTSRIIFRHALKNASLPLISAAGLSFAFIIGGALQTEIIFSWPGIGRLFYDAAIARDYPVLQGAFYFLSVSVLVVNVLTDIAYKFIDPRVEY